MSEHPLIKENLAAGEEYAGRVMKTHNYKVAYDLFDISTDLAVANSYFGLLRQAQHSHHSRARLANVVRRRGRCVKSDLTKTYRRT
jgi:hypothetical protein